MQRITTTGRRIRTKEGTAVISFRVRKGVKRKLDMLPEYERRGIYEMWVEYLEDIEREKEAAKAIDKLKEVMKKRVKPSKEGFAEQAVRKDRYENH